MPQKCYYRAGKDFKGKWEDCIDVVKRDKNRVEFIRKLKEDKSKYISHSTTHPLPLSHYAPLTYLYIIRLSRENIKMDKETCGGVRQGVRSESELSRRLYSKSESQDEKIHDVQFVVCHRTTSQ